MPRLGLATGRCICCNTALGPFLCPPAHGRGIHKLALILSLSLSPLPPESRQMALTAELSGSLAKRRSLVMAAAELRPAKVLEEEREDEAPHTIFSGAREGRGQCSSSDHTCHRKCKTAAKGRYPRMTLGIHPMRCYPTTPLEGPKPQIYERRGPHFQRLNGGENPSRTWEQVGVGPF